MLHNERVVSLK